MNRKGFTLMEILVAVIIVTILAVMAMPMYEKTIERSRLAEARTTMYLLQKAKLAAMANMGCDTYDTTDPKCPKLQHLGVAFKNDTGALAGQPATGTTFSGKYFDFSLEGSAEHPNGICAKRRDGDYSGTEFFYYGVRPDGEEGEFGCKKTENNSCEDYGVAVPTSFTCNFGEE